MPLTNAQILSKVLGIESSEIVNWCQFQGKDIEDEYSWIEYELGEKIIRNFKFIGTQKHLKVAPLLERYEFREIDALLQRLVNDEEYYSYIQEYLKPKYLQKFFSNYYSGLRINDEQAKTLSGISPSTLITARAGSGKTWGVAQTESG